jgi:Bacterial dnaA protein helix-turn-helix
MRQIHEVDDLACAGGSARHIPAVPFCRAAGRGPGLVLELVAQARKVPARLLLHGSRCRAPVALARQIAMYLMHVELGLSLADVARFFDRDRTTVAYACARIEDRRDIRAFDLEIERIECAIQAGLAQGRFDHGSW